MKIIRADERHYSDMGWLRTYWLFSFSNFFDPNNVQFGNLRVFNDDWVAPHSGFPTHSHSEMEIVTIIMEGTLTHEDSTGSEIHIGPGEVQRMSAGTGIQHSEMNRGDGPVSFYQIWFIPSESKLKPGYTQRKFDLSSFHNVLKPIVSGEEYADTLQMTTDATIYRSRLDQGHSLKFHVKEDRGALIYVTEGNLQVNDELLNQKDQARIPVETDLNLTAHEATQFLLIDVTMRSYWVE